jgi:hypothetical protein
VVAKALDDHSGEHHADPATDSEDRRQQADRARDPLPGELVAHDPERQRKDATPEALHRAREHEQRQRRRHRGQQRAHGEAAQGVEQPALLAVHVPQASQYRRADRRGEQVGGEHPARPIRAGMEVVLDGGQRRGHARLQQRVGHRAEGQDREGEARTLAIDVARAHCISMPKPW